MHIINSLHYHHVYELLFTLHQDDVFAATFDSGGESVPELPSK